MASPGKGFLNCDSQSQTIIEEGEKEEYEEIKNIDSDEEIKKTDGAS